MLCYPLLSVALQRVEGQILAAMGLACVGACLVCVRHHKFMAFARTHNIMQLTISLRSCVGHSLRLSSTALLLKCTGQGVLLVTVSGTARVLLCYIGPHAVLSDSTLKVSFQT